MLHLESIINEQTDNTCSILAKSTTKFHPARQKKHQTQQRETATIRLTCSQINTINGHNPNEHVRC